MAIEKYRDTPFGIQTDIDNGEYIKLEDVRKLIAETNAEMINEGSAEAYESVYDTLSIVLSGLGLSPTKELN